MPQTPPLPQEDNKELHSREDKNPYLHTEKQHKDWYNRGLMGNLGDKRGYIAEDREKKPKKKEK